MRGVFDQPLLCQLEALALTAAALSDRTLGRVETLIWRGATYLRGFLGCLLDFFLLEPSSCGHRAPPCVDSSQVRYPPVLVANRLWTNRAGRQRRALLNRHTARLHRVLAGEGRQRDRADRVAVGEVRSQESRLRSYQHRVGHRREIAQWLVAVLAD